MYRLVIEHPEWIDDEVEKTLDLRAGHDKGRIYRVYPRGHSPRPIPDLTRLSPAQLADTLESPNGTVRDMVQRLIVTGHMNGVAPRLRMLVEHGHSPMARLQALCALDGLGALTEEVVLQGLNDADAAVRRHAVRLSESFADHSERLAQALASRVDDADIHVQLQLAYTIGQWSDRGLGRALGRLAMRRVDDPLFVAACMSSAVPHTDDMLEGMLAEATSIDRVAPLMDALVATAIGTGRDDATARLIGMIAKKRGEAYADWQFASLGRLLTALERKNRAIEQLPGGKTLAIKLAGLVDAARHVASTADADVARRSLALGVLGRHSTTRTRDIDTLASLLKHDQPAPLQQAAIDALSHITDPHVSEALLDGWSDYGPTLRENVIGVLMRRETGAEALLNTIDAGRIAVVELGPTYLQQLLEHPTRAIRDRAAQLVQTTTSRTPQQRIDRYLPLVKAAQGDAQRGVAVFAQRCAQCHRVGTVGHGAGPDLAALVDKSASYIVTSVLDPNRAVEDKFFNYTVETLEGELFSGLLAGETSSSVTLMGLSGEQFTVLRQDIVPGTFIRSKRSMMPEGLELFLRPADLADIIAFINANLTPPKSFDGNQPRLVQPQTDGTLRLPASNAEIYGQSLVFESHYKNLGYWMSDDDQAVWSILVPHTGTYEVSMEWAVPDQTANQAFAIITATDRLEGHVPTTTSWDIYEQRVLGRLHLKQGVQRLVMRPTERVRGAMLDLRELKLEPVKINKPIDNVEP